MATLKSFLIGTFVFFLFITAHSQVEYHTLTISGPSVVCAGSSMNLYGSGYGGSSQGTWSSQWGQIAQYGQNNTVWIQWIKSGSISFHAEEYICETIQDPPYWGIDYSWGGWYDEYGNLQYNYTWIYPPPVEVCTLHIYDGSLFVSVLNIPIITYTNGSDICEGQSKNLSANVPAGVALQWKKDGVAIPGATSVNYLATVPGVYTVTLYCGGTSAGVPVAYKQKPLDGQIFANPTSVYLGENVTISSNSGIGTPYYWASTNGGQSWDVFAAQYAGQSSFVFNAAQPGTYRFHLRNQTECGFCWDNNNCNTYPYVDVVVRVREPNLQSVSINTCGPKVLTFGSDPSLTYYWQGLDANSTSTAIPISGTYTVSTSGTYYVRSRTTTGAWSNPRKIQVFVDPIDIVIAEYDPAQPLIQATHSITLGPNFTVPSGSTFSAKIVITSECNDFVNWTEQIAYDQNGQPISDGRTYQDGFGNTILSESIDFLSGKVWASQPLYDNLNNPSASTMPAPILESGFIYKNNFVQNSSNQIYSANDFDKPVVSGLAGELNNPKPVGNAAGTLGWYYSSANNLEPATPTTQFPYSRSYTPPGPNPTTSKSAGVGENNKMGSNHEVSSQKTVFAASEINNYYQVRGYFVAGSVTPSGNVGYKVVSTDPNGKQSSSYTDADGKTLASVTDGKWSYTYYNDVGQVVATVAPNGINTGSPDMPTFVTYYKYDHLGRLIETTSPDEGMSRFVYSTDGKIRFSQNQLQRDAPLQTPPTPARFSYTNYDYLGRLIESGEYEVSGTTPFVFEPHTTAVPASTSVLNIVDNVGYTGVTGNGGDTRCKETNFIQYDAPASDYPTDALHTSQNYLIGQVARTKNENTTTWYSYDEFGQLTWMKQSLPLTQSAQWSALTGVSQNLNTITKNGVTSNWDAGAFSVQSIASNTNGWIEFSAGETNTYKMMGLSATNPNASYSSIAYALYFVNDGTVQIYENGAFKGSFGTYTTTDVFRVERVGTTVYYKKNGAPFYPSTIASTGVLYGDCSLYSPNSSIKNISLSVNSPTKTVDYEYDYFGNVLKVAYQQGQTDAFYHHYDYDKNNRLTVASTSLDGSTKSVRAKYFYYLHGPLKRVELGNNIQGIDYVYNIDGSLKFINHPDPTKDIGKDGLSGTNAAFQRDVFGMALDYNANDYVPAGYADAGSFSLPGTYPDQFGGAVKSIRWHSPSDSHVPRGYAFNYDNRYQLTNADFGSVTGAGSYGLNINTVSGTPNYQQYKEAVTNYDKNGNIYALTRKGKTGNSLANYAYNYKVNTNQLDNVTNGIGGPTLLNYQYNSIGQLTQQTEGTNTMKISYTAYGLTKEIRDGANKLKASYAYDDRGNRVKKTIYNSSEAVQNVTYYVSDAAGNTLATYEQDVAGGGSMYLTEVPIYAAGRVGIYKPLTNYSIYEVNDHLGNVRGVVGNPEPFTYTATMEDNGQPVFSNPRVQEMAYFKNLFATANTAPYMNRTAPSTAVPAPNTSSYTYWKSGFPGITPDLKSIGPAIGITVQPGDKLDMEAYVKFETKPSYSRSSIAGSMATLLANSFVNTAVGLETVAQASQVFNNGLASALSATGIGNGNEVSNRPHAYLYYLLYDRNFNFVTAGWKRVSATSPPGFAPGAEITSVHERVSIPQITITDPGYVYIYVANESEDTRVWWDDLKITHLRSNIVAGADYYPFGLPMENREITREDYRYGYQGQFAEKDKETGWNAFELRMYDARVARWTSKDPKGQFFSPYIGMGNNPVTGVDPDGGWNFPILSQGLLDFLEVYALTGTTSGILSGVTVTATRSVSKAAVISVSAAIKYWEKKGKVAYPETVDQARNVTWGKNKKGEKVIVNAIFNFDDNFSDCVECVLAPMQGTAWFDVLSTQQKGGRNATVQDMIDGLKKEGYSLRRTDPKVDDLAIWTSDGTANGAGKHVARVHSVGLNAAGVAVFSVHQAGKSGIKVQGLWDGKGGPSLTVDNIDKGKKPLGRGKFAGFVTLKP